MYSSALNMRSVFLVLRTYPFLTDNSTQSAAKTNKKAMLWHRKRSMPL